MEDVEGSLCCGIGVELVVIVVIVGIVVLVYSGEMLDGMEGGGRREEGDERNADPGHE